MSNEPYGYVVEIRRTHNWTQVGDGHKYGYVPAPEPWSYYITAGCGELSIFNTPESAARSGARDSRSPGGTYRVIPVILDEANATAWEPCAAE